MVVVVVVVVVVPDEFVIVVVVVVVVVGYFGSNSLSLIGVTITTGGAMSSLTVTVVYCLFSIVIYSIFTCSKMRGSPYRPKLQV